MTYEELLKKGLEEHQPESTYPCTIEQGEKQVKVGDHVWSLLEITLSNGDHCFAWRMVRPKSENVDAPVVPFVPCDYSFSATPAGASFQLVERPAHRLVTVEAGMKGRAGSTGHLPAYTIRAYFLDVVFEKSGIQEDLLIYVPSGRRDLRVIGRNLVHDRTFQQKIVEGTGGWVRVELNYEPPADST